MFGLQAQTDVESTTIEISNTIYSLDFKVSKASVYSFLSARDAKIVYQRESETVLDVKFVLDKQGYEEFDKLAADLGYSTSKRINTVSNSNRINEITLELNHLKAKKKSYQDLLDSLGVHAESYMELWRAVKSIDEEILLKQKEILRLNIDKDAYIVTLELNDEVLSPKNSKVSFVNMPGVEYSYLNLDSPLDGETLDHYSGIMLKYLFTRGKSFASIGLYKNRDLPESDSLSHSELFTFSFGQDFYSRHLGRGSRKFLNLYSGYMVGFMFATGESSEKNILYLSPAVGLELYKNKFVLLDTKVSYLIPLKSNREYRAVCYSASLNFVF